MSRWVGCCACVLSLVASAGEPCPSGQELREGNFPASQTVKERGCATLDSQGNYLKQGKWQFYFETGAKKAKATYKGGKMDGLTTTWDEYGRKNSEVRFKDGNTVTQ